MIAVFTYGTLEIPEVMEAVTGRSFPSFDATATGYVRYLLKGKIYPGMMVGPGASTSGRVYVEINEQTLKILDEFEDEIYERELIEVIMHPKKSCKAFAYLIPQSKHDLLSSEPWKKEEFLSMYFDSYVQACRFFHDGQTSSLK